ncbi:hypothetical protein CMEL01_13147 [Colletotrichum melonis]|uniref:Uncharacterized protein n=1 Tax=Colletotrichum melonis TaxID=1209925 RepID=A0AAI9UQY3_9PEZI|nr:hypothetical protein CMEL01_13147 [Colletotrichum melonis]
MATPGSLYPPPTTPTSDFAYVITNCAKAKVKWELRSASSGTEDEEIIGDLQSEDGHGHLPLKFPGPLPDHFGASVVCYSRQNPDGSEYEVINSAVNDPKQRIAFSIRLVVGYHPQALPMTAVSEDDEEIRIVKFVVGQADPLIDSMSFFLPLWLEAHQFDDVLRRDRDIERKKSRYRKEFSFETERVARTSAYLMQLKKKALQ